MKSGIHSPAFLTTALILVLGIVALISKASSASGAMYFVPLALGPLLVSLMLAATLPHRRSQVTLIIGSLLYALWFGFVFVDAFHWHPDPQSGIALLFIGAYSLPVMVPVWLIAWIRRRSKGAEDDSAD